KRNLTNIRSWKGLNNMPKAKLTGPIIHASRNEDIFLRRRNKVGKCIFARPLQKSHGNTFENAGNVVLPQLNRHYTDSSNVSGERGKSQLVVLISNRTPSRKFRINSSRTRRADSTSGWQSEMRTRRERCLTGEIP
ncbi:hypothetical protein L9F63_021999, partial [Diploptera punctata]